MDQGAPSDYRPSPQDYQASPLRVSGVRRVKDAGLGLWLVGGDTQLNRPFGVTVISIIYFIVGGLLLTLTIRLFWDVLSIPDVDGFIAILGLVLAVILLPIAVLFILTAIGLWRRRRWGLILAFISSVVALLWFLLVAIQGTYQGLIFVLAEAAILFYLAQRRVRAHFG